MKELDPYKPLLSLIEERGYSAYFVGGCVRDALFNRLIKDVDIASTAPTDEIIDIFSDFPLDFSGIAFKTVSFQYKKTPVTITTFRKEGAYTKHRYPSEVSYTQNIEEDASRRDFTINAIYINAEDHVFDFYLGLEHIKEKRLVSIKPPQRSMSEDALRILRALRFAATYQLSFDDELIQAIKDHASLVNKLSRHSLDSELDKLKRHATIEQQTKFYEYLVRFNIRM